MNELPYWNNDAVFITLTYNDDNLPKDYGLHKEDLQNFFKRLRKDLELENRKIKYFACGEYGDKYGRPHYHSIVFGLPYNEHSRQLIKDNWRFCDLDRFNPTRYGKEQGFAPVSIDDIRYVCGYVQKKWNGKKALEVYGERLSPFQLQSQGLGKQFALDNEELIKTVGIKFRGHNVSIPRYYYKKLDLKSNDFGFNHKLEYLVARGYDINDIKRGAFSVSDFQHYKALIEKMYVDESRDSLEQADKELSFRYSME